MSEQLLKYQLRGLTETLDRVVTERDELREQLAAANARAEIAVTCNVQALAILASHGQADGAHHKAWVIDQVARALLGDQYDDWIANYRQGDEYDWDTGIAP